MSTRSSSWPRGRCARRGMWPASKASLSRTSSRTSGVARLLCRCACTSAMRHERRSSRAASASSCATVLPPLRFVRSASVRCVGISQVEAAASASTNSARSRLLQARVAGASRRRSSSGCGPCSRAPGTPAVVVGQLQQLAEQAVVERVGIAGRQVGAAGAADQQRVAGEARDRRARGTSSRPCGRACAGRARAACRRSASRRRRPAGRRTARRCARCITTGAPSCRPARASPRSGRRACACRRRSACAGPSRAASAEVAIDLVELGVDRAPRRSVSSQPIRYDRQPPAGSARRACA